MNLRSGEPSCCLRTESRQHDEANSRLSKLCEGA